MPRQARLDYEGCLHHVMNRGIERRVIFSGKEDYEFFKESMGSVIGKCGNQCYAWVLMPNHFHLLIETGKIGLSTFMSKLLTRYAGYYNRKHKRSGRLFQNRYKTVLCDGDTYFKELVAYIHLNPLRGELVKDLGELERYKWSGHCALMGKEKSEWYSVGEVLERFGSRSGEARKRYVEYLRTQKNVKKDLSGRGLIRSAGGLRVVLRENCKEREEYDSRILGDGEFVKSALRKGGNRKEDLELGKQMNLEGINIQGDVLELTRFCGHKNISIRGHSFLYHYPNIPLINSLFLIASSSPC